MTYEEFEENLEKINEEYNHKWTVSGDSVLVVRDEENCPLAAISRKTWLTHSFDYVAFRELPAEEKGDLFCLVFTLSRTFLEERIGDNRRNDNLRRI